jgi:uncharacterized protein (TIGR03437 family)
VTAQVTITNAFNESTEKFTTISSSIANGGIYRTNIGDPPDSTFQTDSATPLRAMCFVLTQDPDLGLLTWPPPIISQDQQVPTISWTENAASQNQTAVSPGEIITIFGQSVGPSTPAGFMPGPDGKVPTNLSDVQMFFNGIAAPLLYASATQVNALVPYELATDNVAMLQLEYNGVSSVGLGIPVAPAAPAIFTLDSTGQGGAVVLNQDDSVNSPSNPAARGSTIQIFATGYGVTSPPSITGEITDTEMKKPVLPVGISIAGVNATVTDESAAPYAVTGLLQVAAVVPQSIASGPAVPLVLTVGTAASQSNLTIAVN